VKAQGGAIHCFAVGRVLEQEQVDWLKEIVQAGHPVGNHTYDHVNVKATRPEEIQFRFRRSPWLIGGRSVREVIHENIRLTSAALKARIGIDPAGFRTPGGFANGLADRADVQQLLLDLGFAWVSSKYRPIPWASPERSRRPRCSRGRQGAAFSATVCLRKWPGRGPHEPGQRHQRFFAAAVGSWSTS